jgi:hypothetical protein
MASKNPNRIHGGTVKREDASLFPGASREKFRMPPPLKEQTDEDTRVSKISFRVTREEADELCLSLAFMKVCFSDHEVMNRLSKKYGLPESFTKKHILEPNSKMCENMMNRFERSERKLLKINEPKKDTYFTKPIPVTGHVKDLYSSVKDVDNLTLRHDQVSNTSPRDVYSMVKRYIEVKGLVQGDHIMLDDFLKDKLFDKDSVLLEDDKSFLGNSNKSIWNIVRYIVNHSRNAAE